MRTLLSSILTGLSAGVLIAFSAFAVLPPLPALGQPSQNATPSEGESFAGEPAASDSVEAAFLQSIRILRHLSDAPLTPSALQRLPQPLEAPIYLTETDHPDIGASSDTLTEAQILRRMARIYEYQGKLLTARAQGDFASVEELLDLSAAALKVLLGQPGIMENVQFHELYRTVIAEHESYYGFSDSLAIQQGDIYRIRNEIFDLLNAEHRAPLESIVLPELSFAETSIPMTVNEKVKSSIVFLLTEPDKHINHWLSRAETYFPMIEQIFEEEGVPDELKYLAMIESGLNPRARSWARAVGMWQFIRATGAAYGLEANGWVDERRNPEKSTRAAARHLRDLYRMFGDWQLALAGYNYSPGKLRRHIRRAEARLGRKATYWDVYNRLPRETRNYVPMFIATALVASNPEAFGLEGNYTPGPAYEFDYVPVQGMLTLDEIAEMSGTDVETIQALNPELKGDRLPPTRSAYFVRIPLYSYPRFAEQYRALPAAARAPASHHRVRSGETLGQIARRYGVSVSSLMRKNGLHSSLIRVGQNLVVPSTHYSGGLALTGEQPMRIQYGMRFYRPIAPNLATALDAGLLITRAEERAAELRAEEEAAEREAARIAAAQTPSSSSSTAASSPSASDNEAGNNRIVYRVRKGDTLIDIAKKYRVTVRQIREWNNIRSNLIRIGQRLTIYSP